MKNEDLTRYFASWDPMGFISELEAPEDEYAQEAEDIAKTFRSDMTDQQLSELVFNVFVNSVELNPIGFRDDIKARISEIRSILS